MKKVFSLIILVIFLLALVSANNNFNDFSIGSGEESPIEEEGYQIYFINDSVINQTEVVESDKPRTNILNSQSSIIPNNYAIKKPYSGKNKIQTISRINNNLVNQNDFGKNLKIIYSNNTGTPKRMLGNIISTKNEKSSIKGVSKNNNAENFLKNNEERLGINFNNLKISNKYKNERFESYTYQQTYLDIPVWGSSVGITIEDNKDIILAGAEYYKNIDLDPNPQIQPAEAINLLDLDNNTQIVNISLFVFPLEKEKNIELHLVWKIDTFSKEPLKALSYFVDAHNGNVIFKYDSLIFYSDKIYVSGKASANIYPENTKNALQTKSLAHLYLSFYDYDPFDSDDILGNSPYLTDSNGDYDSGWMNIMTDPFGGQGEPYLTSYLEGPYVKVLNDDGNELYHYYDLTINPLTARYYNFNFNSGHEQNVFYHINKIHDFFKGSPYNLNAMDYQMTATVGLGDNYCNAYYSPQEGNVAFGAGDPSMNCGNLALDSDIIYHEYTHGTMDHIYYLPYYSQSGAISEALADYYACTINGNSLQGEGTLPSEYVRNLKNNNRYPDDWVGEVHDDSLIVSGAFWDVRELLGKTYTDYLIYQAVQLSPHAFTFEEFLENILLVDDNNNNLNDGTPNDNEICGAFKTHGITSSFCDQLLDCKPFIVSYPQTISQDDEATIYWNNPCDTIHTNIHYCSPGYSCSYSNSEFFGLTKSGLIGDYSDTILFNEEGTWDFFIHSTSGSTEFYSDIKQVSVYGNAKIKTTNSFSDTPLDINSNGLYDNLIIGVGLNVSNSGTYEVGISLADINGSYILWGYNHSFLDIGSQNVNIPLDGKAIRKNGIDGPYNLQSIWIYDENYSLVTHKYPSYNTSAYSYLNFEKPDLVIQNSYTPSGNDIDNNGLFEYLTIDISAMINKEGNYYVSGYLTNKSEGWCNYVNAPPNQISNKRGNHLIEDGNFGNSANFIYNDSDYCSEYNEKVYLATNESSIRIYFEGGEINDRKLNSPLYLRYISVYDENNNYIDSKYDPYNFTSYNYSKFEKSSKCIKPTNNYYEPVYIDNSTIFCDGTYNLQNGVEIRSDNIVLDCNGATLHGGNNVIWGIFGFINTGGNNVTIKNCNLEEYSYGIDVEGGNHLIFNNTISNSVTGIEIGRGNNNKVFANKIINTNKGIWLWSQNSIIFDNEIQNAEVGILFFVQNQNNSIFNNNISSSVYSIDTNEDGSGYDGVDNYIWNNNLYNSPINYKSRYNNRFCVEGIGNNYYNGATGPACDLYCDINYNEDDCKNCKYPRRFIDENIILCKGEYNFPEGLYVTDNNIVIDCINTILIGNKLWDNFLYKGVHINNQNNITIKNCEFKNYSTGIYLIQSNFSKIINNHVLNNTDGIRIVFSHNNYLINNTIIDSTYSGLDLAVANNNRLIGNVLINNSKGLSLNYGQEKDNYIVENYFYKTGISDTHTSNNIYCEGKIGNSYYNGATGPICDIWITSPKNGDLFKSSPIVLNVTLPYVERLSYSDNGARERNLCTDCETKSQRSYFDDGLHNVTFFGRINNTISYSNSVLFTMETKKPKISTIKPSSNKYTNGSGFYIKYTEANLRNTTLFYGLDNTEKDNCDSGINKNCTFSINLSKYDNQSIIYRFRLTDIAGNNIESKNTTIKVDTTAPEIKDFKAPVVGRYVYFNMTILNEDKNSLNKVEYNDNSGSRWSSLCTSLKNNNCFKKVYFRTGNHNIVVRATDDAGNSDTEIINVNII